MTSASRNVARRRVKAIERHIGAARSSAGAGGRSTSPSSTPGALAGQRRHGEAAGVAIAVEHLLRSPQALHAVGKALAAVALVQVEAGLVALGDVQRQRQLVLVDLSSSGAPPRPRSPRSQPVRRQALPAGARWRRALVQARQTRGLEQRVGQHRPSSARCPRW